MRSSKNRCIQLSQEGAEFNREFTMRGRLNPAGRPQKRHRARRTAMITKRAFLSTVAMAGTAAIGLGATAFRPALAQTYPSNVIRIVVPNTASTPPDIISRVVAAELSDSEGWRVIVENRPGAIMTIGGSDVLRQPADGYSIYAIAVPLRDAARRQCAPLELDWLLPQVRKPPPARCGLTPGYMILSPIRLYFYLQATIPAPIEGVFRMPILKHLDWNTIHAVARATASIRRISVVQFPSSYLIGQMTRFQLANCASDKAKHGKAYHKPDNE
jgi:hypothetical protein